MLLRWNVEVFKLVRYEDNGYIYHKCMDENILYIEKFSKKIRIGCRTYQGEELNSSENVIERTTGRSIPTTVPIL